MSRAVVPMEPVRPGEQPVTCSWWAMCSRPAVVEVEHPVLGSVPTCHRCARRILELGS